MTSSESPSERGPTRTAAEWQRRYQEADTPWDSGLVDVELQRVVDEYAAAVKAAGGSLGSAVEFGCGTGTNALYLAQAGFAVTAIDYSPLAIEKARHRAAACAVDVRWLVGDLATIDSAAESFDFFFDRGCYHCVRRAGQLSGYLKAIERLMRPGGTLLILAGNADDSESGGPPKVAAADLVGDFEKHCRIERLAAYCFQEADGSAGPLAWSALLRRR